MDYHRILEHILFQRLPHPNITHRHTSGNILEFFQIPSLTACYFPFLLDPSTDRHVTYHYTEDGYCTKIKYDTDMKISEISHTLM